MFTLLLFGAVMGLYFFVIGFREPDGEMMRRAEVRGQLMTVYHEAASEYVLKDNPSASGLIDQNDVESHYPQADLPPSEQTLKYKFGGHVSSAADGSGTVVTWLKNPDEFNSAVGTFAMRKSEKYWTAGVYDADNNEIKSKRSHDADIPSSITSSASIPDGTAIMLTEN